MYVCHRVAKMGDASKLKYDIRKRERDRYGKRPETNLNFAMFM